MPLTSSDREAAAARGDALTVAEYDAVLHGTEEEMQVALEVAAARARAAKETKA